MSHSEQFSCCGCLSLPRSSSMRLFWFIVQSFSARKQRITHASGDLDAATAATRCQQWRRHYSNRLCWGIVAATAAPMHAKRRWAAAPAAAQRRTCRRFFIIFCFLQKRSKNAGEGVRISKNAQTLQRLMRRRRKKKEAKEARSVATRVNKCSLFCATETGYIQGDLCKGGSL
jgi:hypothetical protein